MRWQYLSQKEQTTYDIAILSTNTLNAESKYRVIDPSGFDPNNIIWIEIPSEATEENWKANDFKQWFKEDLAPFLLSFGSRVLLCQDSKVFKLLTGKTKTTNQEGYAVPSLFGDFRVFLCPTNKALWLHPIKHKDLLLKACTAASKWLDGTYVEPGTGIIHNAAYPSSLEDIQRTLSALKEYPELTVDIETFSLKHYDAGIASISFAINKHEGISFLVDPSKTERNIEVRYMLKEFFKSYEGKTIYHNICFDVYVLVYQLYMDDLLDTEGLLNGLEILLKNWDDTKLIAYLATNSCAGNTLSLKALAQEFAGNYAQKDIQDVSLIPVKELLEYNLVDALSTWFVYDKYLPQMLADDQESVYVNIFKPAVKDIIQMQLTGLPINMKKVEKLAITMEHKKVQLQQDILSFPVVQQYIDLRNQEWVNKKNQEYKVKKVTLADANETFNPNSDQQVSRLLYEMLGLPVINTTKKGNPSTDADTLTKLVNQTENPDIKKLISSLSELGTLTQVADTFVTAFQQAQRAKDGWHYLFGNLNLGGTVSGRLSSSEPNLQNIPSNSVYSKYLKDCVEAPEGWLFTGIDFNALEDRISALTTRDPAKLAVYLEGYDGHCLRAYNYWPELMPDIDPKDVNSVNSIEKKYPALRSKSKSPTFALTYAGTYRTLMNNLGFLEEDAKKIEANFKKLYSASIDWVQSHLDQAAKTGYVTVAFGLRLRTPLLQAVLRGTSKTPSAAEAEGRTAGNALGQSWGLLNTRAGSEFMNKVRSSKHRLNIRPCVHIHDAQYYLIKEDLDAVHYANTHLVKAVEWQEHPLIWHDQVKLGGKFAIYFPTWNEEIKLPNHATPEEILNVVTSKDSE